MVSKKSKRYCLSRLVSNASNVNPVENETESSCASKLETSTHSEKSATLHSPRPTSDKSVTCKTVTNDQSTQSNIAKRNFTVQCSVLLVVKSTQTIKNTNIVRNQSSQCNGTHISPCDAVINELKEDGTLEKFLQNLVDHEQTDKFIKTVKSLANGIMPFTNLAWKCCLDMGKLFSLKSTTTMDYDPEWLEFCQVLYHMFRVGVINALCGRGHFSTVTRNKTCKGKYSPSDGEFNFPVPSIPTLKKLDIGFPSEILVGFITQSLEIAERKAKEGCEFMLSFDGKLIALGCKGESNGDANLWGLEGPPTLSQSLKVLKNTLSAAQKINVDMCHTAIPLHFTHLRELLNVSSRRIKRLQGRITGCFYLRKKLFEKCKDSDKLQYKHRRKMSSLNQNTSECETVVHSLLEIYLACTKIMALLNSNHDVHIGSNVRHIILTEHANNFQLLPPKVVNLFMDLDNEDNVQFIKQHSKKWFEIRSKAYVMGSTIYTALGLDTLTKQKEHHYIHVRGCKPPPTF